MPIEAQRDAAVRRRAEAESAQDVTEHRLLLFFAHAERGEHLRLQIGLVNPDAAAADLHAVQHDVVGLRARLRRTRPRRSAACLPSSGG